MTISDHFHMNVSDHFHMTVSDIKDAPDSTSMYFCRPHQSCPIDWENTEINCHSSAEREVKKNSPLFICDKNVDFSSVSFTQIQSINSQLICDMVRSISRIMNFINKYLWNQIVAATVSNMVMDKIDQYRDKYGTFAFYNKNGNMEILSFPRCSIYDQISPMPNQSKQFYNFSKHQSYFEEYGNIENMSCCKSPKIYLLCFLVCCNLVRMYIKLEQQSHRQTNCPVKKCLKQFHTQSESNVNYQVIDQHSFLADYMLVLRISSHIQEVESIRNLTSTCYRSQAGTLIIWKMFGIWNVNVNVNTIALHVWPNIETRLASCQLYK